MFYASFDGSLRKNCMFVGYVIYDSEGKVVHKHGQKLDDKPATVNIAEFKALNQLLTYCVENDIKEINVSGDSATVIGYVLGQYRSKNIYLVHETNVAQELIRKFTKFDIRYISREFNSVADAECRKVWFT